MRQAFEFLDNYHSDEEGLSIKGLSKRHAITTEIAGEIVVLGENYNPLLSYLMLQ